MSNKTTNAERRKRMASKETKIAKCPMKHCQKTPTTYKTFVAFPSTTKDCWVVTCDCGYSSIRAFTEGVAIAAHNTLCADIERGKLAAEAIDLLDEYSSTSTYIKRVANFLDGDIVTRVIEEQKKGRK